MSEVRWERYPRIASCSTAKAWLRTEANLGLSSNTVDAYGRALQDYLAFSHATGLVPETATREHVSLYVRDLTSRKTLSGLSFANATLQQRLTALRLFYDYLMEEGVRANNPIGRGRYTPGKAFCSKRDRGLIPHYRRLPWIPTEQQWKALVEAARQERPRNRVMLALSYDGALRREELCGLETSDIDPAHRLLRIRSEITKNRCGRVVPYSEATGALYARYLQRRRELSRERGPLFLSESRRNPGQPVSIWTWSKVVRTIAKKANVPEFSTHTARHLCLTDLARAGWDLHEIARFAGHRSVQSTLLYIHLSGKDLSEKLARGMAELRARRVSLLAEVLA